MKNTMYRMVICISFFAILSCGKDTKEQESKKSLVITEKEETMGDEPDINLTDSKSDIVFTDESVNNIYNQYLNIKRGLVNSKPKIVQQEAKKLEVLVDTSNSRGQLKSVSKLISLTKGIDKQRDFFVTLTEEMAKLVSDASITSGEVYKQFCPMAFDGAGGFWLSNSKEIRNPYFGNKMLKCGSVKEIIQ